MDTVKARGGDSARSDDLSTCSAKAYQEGSDSPRAVGAFSRFSDGATASSFTSNDDTAAAQQDGQPMQDEAISQEEEQLADWEIPEDQLTYDPAAAQPAHAARSASCVSTGNVFFLRPASFEKTNMMFLGNKWPLLCCPQDMQAAGWQDVAAGGGLLRQGVEGGVAQGRRHRAGRRHEDDHHQPRSEASDLRAACR